MDRRAVEVAWDRLQRQLRHVKARQKEMLWNLLPRAGIRSRPPVSWWTANLWPCPKEVFADKRERDPVRINSEENEEYRVLVRWKYSLICLVYSMGNGSVFYRPGVDKYILMRLAVSEIAAVRDKSRQLHAFDQEKRF
jgi:hypothetical protein